MKKDKITKRWGVLSRITVAGILLFATFLSGCGATTPVDAPATAPSNESSVAESSTLYDVTAQGGNADESNTGHSVELSQATRIQITAGNTVLYAELFENPTAAAFTELLPLTLNTFDRIGLVKSTNLPQRISDEGERTREYVRGAVFYWPEGPEVAFCYSDHLPETVVDIIHIGLIEEGVELFESYSGEILVELAGAEYPDIVENE